MADRRQEQLILTTGFWHHIGDDVVRRLAARKRFPLVELGDLEMWEIANRIYDKIKLFCNIT